MAFPSEEEIVRESIVYKAHAEAVAFVNAANLAQLRGLRTCFCQTTRCSAAATVGMRGFEQTFISFLGKKQTETISCADIVPKFIEKVRIANSEARIGLAIGYAKDLGYRRNISSPLTTGLELEPLSEAEQQFVITKIHDHGLEKNFRRSYAELYLKAIKENNIVLYIDVENVTSQHIVAALDRMIVNAESRLEFQVRRPFDFERSKWAMPYTEALLRHQYPNDDFTKEIESIQSQGASAQLLATAAEVIGVVGSVFVCRLIPVGKPLVFLARLAARRGCQVFLTGAASLYFLVESSLQQKALLKFYMSSIETSKTRVTRGQLLSAQAQVYLAVLTLPFAAL